MCLSFSYIFTLFRIDGLVEITWQGRNDWHGTLHSESEEGSTRFGTSVQVTKSVADSVSKLHEAGDPQSRITTAEDRINVSANHYHNDKQPHHLFIR